MVAPRMRVARFALALMCPVALVACGIIRLPALVLSSGSSCPFEDESFCNFMVEFETALESGDTLAFLGLVRLLDCQQYGHGFYGPVPDNFCGSSQWCLRQGRFFGEGLCAPLPEPPGMEDVLGGQYLSIDGIVYPGFPYRAASTGDEGPAIFIRVSGMPDVQALIAAKESGVWGILRTYPYDEGIGGRLGVLGTAIPWMWPYEENLAWLGLQLPLDTWQIGDHPWDAETTRYAVLAHRSLDACRIGLLAHDPYLLAGRPQDWQRDAASVETDAVLIQEVRYSDPGGKPALTVYRVVDISQPQVSGASELGFFLLENAESSDECASAVRSLLLTIEPGEFPDLPVARG